MLQRVRMLLLLIAAASLLPVCGNRPGQAQASATDRPGLPGGRAFESTLNRDNPLVGRIYSVREKLFITPAELIDRLAGERFVLLGEIHDNPDHHRLQAFVIAELTRRGRRPGVVMEQINADQQGLLTLFQSGRNKTAERLGPAIEWQQHGWPDWKIYQPIAEAAFSAGLTLHAGDISKDTARLVGKDGLGALGESEVRNLGLQRPLPAPLEGALVEELVLSHCSTMPAEQMRPMLYVQRYRDAHLARALLQADAGDGAVLIAGNGHVRTDRAVPWYLRERKLAGVTLMIVEASREAGDPLELAAANVDGTPATDYIWITPGTAREDPCDGLRKRFKK